MSTMNVTEGLGGIFIFLGKVLVSVANTLVAYAIFEEWTELRDKVNSVLPVLAAVLLATYIVSSVFMSVYSVASVAILQCFLTDVELSKASNNGEATDGKHRPKELESLVKALRK